MNSAIEMGWRQIFERKRIHFYRKTEVLSCDTVEGIRPFYTFCSGMKLVRPFLLLASLDRVCFVFRPVVT